MHMWKTRCRCIIMCAYTYIYIYICIYVCVCVHHCYVNPPLPRNDPLTTGRINSDWVAHNQAGSSPKCAILAKVSWDLCFHRGRVRQNQYVFSEEVHFPVTMSCTQKSGSCSIWSMCKCGCSNPGFEIMFIHHSLLKAIRVANSQSLPGVFHRGSFSRIISLRN